MNNYSLFYFFVCTVNFTTVDFNKLFDNLQFKSLIEGKVKKVKIVFLGGWR